MTSESKGLKIKHTGWDLTHEDPPLAQSHFASGLNPVFADSEPDQEFRGGICAPPDLPLRQCSYPSRRKDSPRPRRLGRGGIWTHGRVAPTPDFESGTLNRSATRPFLNIGKPPPCSSRPWIDAGAFHPFHEVMVWPLAIGLLCPSLSLAQLLTQDDPRETVYPLLAGRSLYDWAMPRESIFWKADSHVNEWRKDSYGTIWKKESGQSAFKKECCSFYGFITIWVKI